MGSGSRRDRVPKRRIGPRRLTLSYHAGGGTLRFGMGEQEHTWVLCPSSGCSYDAVLSGRQALPSTDGPIEHATVSCAAGHQFFMPSDRLMSDVLPVERADRSRTL